MSSYPPSTTYPLATGYPPSHNRSKIRFDCSYLRTKPGVLKLLEMIFNVIAAGSFVYHINVTLGHNGLQIYTYFVATPESEIYHTIGLGAIFFKLLGTAVGNVILILIILYLFHVVETYPKIPWYTIEYIAFVVFGIMSLICGSISAYIISLKHKYYTNVETEFFVSAVFAFGLAVTFFYNIFVIYKRKSRNIPPQTSEP